MVWGSSARTGPFRRRGSSSSYSQPLFPIDDAADEDEIGRGRNGRRREKQT